MQVKARIIAQEVNNQTRLEMYRQRLDLYSQCNKQMSAIEFPVLVDRCLPLPSRIRHQLSS
ncbi:hypothetical protein [Pelagibaculum spongiae]|uniref:Uncharacterized protein n=1 Tax=Pelagibaculum spongiae TaxID=2080658 RepID=A0A2V1GTF5_9GAMM|nr:hypothetical protein [Pelagibaculum spongiae]PVZ68955.1 hypothetical protein DC094_11965 [Pelagibaculum spongiae]